MPPSGMFRRVALARTDVSEARIATTIRMTRIGDLGKTFTVTAYVSTSPIRFILMM
jgi:hypothetical protein